MRFNNLLLIGSLSLWCASGLCIPQQIIDLIEFQAPEFKTILETSTQPQALLILERYTNQLLASPFSRDLKVDKAELREYLFSKFRPDAPNKEEQKKAIPEPKFSASIDAEIQRLKQAFKGEYRDGLLRLNFTCDKHLYELPFKVEAAGPVAFSMALHGVRVPETKMETKSTNKCLSLFMLAKNQPADLESLNTRNVACPVPIQRAGTCLLSAAEEIVSAIGRTKVKLTDASSVRCELNREAVSLWNLRLYQGKPGWYESKSYKALPDGLENRVKTARSYLLADLKASLGQSLPLFNKWALEFEASQKNATVAQFMAWLWDKDCSAYSQIDKVITTPAKGVEYGNIFPQIIAFQKFLF